ncbi:MAG: DUF4124 domain-containing protein [Gammaproteobacteria bacterium]
MKAKQLITLVTAVLVCMSGPAIAGKHKDSVYHWTDKDGVMHYGDRIPPEHSSTGHVLLNDQGIEIGRVDGEKTEAEKEAARRQAELLAEKRKARDASLLRDKVLLSTYLSIDEIEALRDRRIELVAGQIRVTQIYLDNLRGKLLGLEKEAQRFHPYSTNPDARPIDQKLARELSNTLDSILLYEQNMARLRNEQDQLAAKFAADISRFEQLTTLN